MDISKPKKDTFFLLSIFIIAFCLRLGYLFFLHKNYFFYNYPSGDVDYYLKWADAIDSGDWLGKGTFWGLPLYPYFLAIIKRLSLGSLFVMKLFNLLMGASNCALTYIIAKRIFPGNIKIAKFASLLALTNFMLIYYDCLMMPVTLLIMLGLIITLTFLSFDDTTKFHEYCLLGILIGIASLGDGKFIIFTILFFLFTLYKNQQRLFHTLMKPILPLSLGMIIVLFPVTLRNKIIGGDWVFISAQSGLSFYVGNNPDSIGIFQSPEFISPSHEGQDEDQVIVAQALTQRTLRPREVSNFWRQKSLDYILENPLAFLNLLKTKLLLFLTEHEGANDLDLILQKNWRIKFDINPYFIICPLAILGIILTQDKIPKTIYPNLIIISQLIITLIFFLTARHRITILPFLLIYQSYTLFWLVKQFRDLKIKYILGAVIFLSLFLMFFKPYEIDPETANFIFHTKAGNVYERKMDYKNAKLHYLESLKLKPHNSVALYNIANIYIAENKLKEAEAFYVKALQISPYNVNIMYNLGYCYEQQGKLSLALDFYYTVLNLVPQSPDAHLRIANIYIKQGQCQKSKTHLKAIASVKDYTKAAQNLLTKCN